MKAVCWMGKKKMEVQTVDDPRILNPRDCIVRITATAICGLAMVSPKFRGM